MRVRVLDGPEGVARAAAECLTAAAARRPSLVLALPTGRTPIPFYAELAHRHASGLDLSQARGFNLDELALPKDDSRTFHAFMARHAWERTGLRRERCDIPDGSAEDLAAECQRYEEAILAAGGLDLAILGLGADGHVAYNMPGPVRMPTHVVSLPDGLAASLEIPFESRPLRAITMGLGTIRASRSLLVLATGPSKARAARALVQGPPCEDWPCSLLADHPRIEVLLDRPAAGDLDLDACGPTL